MTPRVQALIDAVEQGRITMEEAGEALVEMGIDPADYAGEFEVAAWYAEQGV